MERVDLTRDSRVFAGLSYGWWRAKHNRHHAAPNQEGRDPDIGPGAIAFTPDAATQRTGFAGWFARHQGWLFFPLLTLEGLNLHAGERGMALAKPHGPHQRVEAALVGARLAAYVVVLLCCCRRARRAPSSACRWRSSGSASVRRSPPTTRACRSCPPTAKIDFLRRQVLMSRNIRGALLVDFAMGGLNYQIEHHLFPSMPRPNLKRARSRSSAPTAPSTG